MSRQGEKDAELDQRIIALRKKNQALLRRYQVSRLCRGLGGPTGWALPVWCAGLSLRAQPGDRVGGGGLVHLRGCVRVLGTL